METSSHAQGFTRRFVAGQTLPDVLRVSERLLAEKTLSSLDHLGENVTSVEEAQASARFYEEAIAAIRQSGLPSTVSVKLTQLGLDLGEDLCRRQVLRLAQAAQGIGSRVEIDMESAEYTDRTLAIVHDLHEQTGAVRAVIQAYLFRSEKDIRELNRRGIPIRLCKGAYNEPPEVAFKDKTEVDRNYQALTRLMLDDGVDPAFATHDPAMLATACEHGRGRREGFEFQMLYGVRRDLQKKLVDEGWRLRLYVPYGDAWYPYFMRRLAERPANVLFVARSLLRA